MAQPDLRRLVPDASEDLRDILNPERGPVERPVRSEIFGPERFAQHGRSLGETHRAEISASASGAFFPRLQDNIRVLREAHAYIAAQATTGYDVSPAAEWLLDNFHLIEGQLKEIHDGLPRRYFADLPVLIDEPLAGLPRVYGVAWAFVAHTDGAFDETLLMQFLSAYQQTRELTLGELWALPTTLRVVLVENLRRLAERVATNKAARQVANLCCDRIETISIPTLDELLTLLHKRGVGRTFLAQVAQRLLDERAPGLVPYHEWLARALPDLAAVQTQQPADQAADNLSVSNAIGSLRLIGNADWPEIVAHTSATLQALLTSAAFAAERDDTRDQTLHAVEALARRSGRSEHAVADTLLALMHGKSASASTDVADERADEANAAAGGVAKRDAKRDPKRPANPEARVASYWLFGPGRPELLRVLGLDERFAVLWHRLRHRAALPAYLLSLGAGTVGLVAWMLLRHTSAPWFGASDGAAPAVWLTLLAALLMLFPASEAVVAVINRLIGESARPSQLPRLALAHGIPADHRVMVVIPGMLTGAHSADELSRRLEMHYLANPEAQAQFALLTDWADSVTEHLPTDEALLRATRSAIEALNTTYPASAGHAPRFILLHRARRLSPTEQRWIGWERKRGKLEQLIGVLATGKAGGFFDLGHASRIAPNTRYVVTLDSDTQLPPGRLRELVGVAAHPHNQPRLDATRRRVIGGYGILQPRVATPLPAPKDFTLYHWLFAGQCGIDPYSAASSEVYQDVFGEGSFTGKGLLVVSAMHAVLSNRLPEGQVLSHDLLEGSMARCAAVTDINVIEDAPFHADVAASRVHRWTRGDWQLLPFLLHPARYDICAINRWKMIDNLRRSLVAPMSLALLVLALGTGAVGLGAAFALVLAAYTAGPFMGAIAALAPGSDSIAKWHFYRLALADLLRAACSGAWLMAQLLQMALMATDAVVRALYRMAVSRRHLLEWTTAAAAQANASTELSAIVAKHWGVPIAAFVLLVGLLLAPNSAAVPSLLVCLVWGASPLWTWWVSRPRPAPRDASLPPQDQAYLEGMARDTWRLFERCVGPADNHLPPDNLQVTPHAIVAHRTSPTNIGLYLLAAACARQFGWIGSIDFITRLEATLETLATLPRHRGHFLNWYDTQTRAALLPMYVSTVDSGNLSGHLLAVAQACIELARKPFDTEPAHRAMAASSHRLASLRGAVLDAVPDGPLARLLAVTDPTAESAFDASSLDDLVNEAAHELAGLLPTDDDDLIEHGMADEFQWRAADHIATLRSALLDVMAARMARMESPGNASASDASHRLLAIARTCERLAWEADFAFLYHRKRHLLHIGFRVAEQQLDASFYDLLASESRLTSLLAIAKGDVPVKHWGALGRPFYALGPRAGLRSWSGSMFEYLMPSLVLDEPHGSVLNEACHAALHEQFDFGREQHVPWGISESAYAASDHTLAYQYAPQGVPRLALRRTPSDELVVAPYATALAAQIAPHLAVANFQALEQRVARGRYGFIEALDFSPARQSEPGGFTRVATFMAHHQGMSIVALANVLLAGTPRRWGMANAHIEAVASLLHERAPREVSELAAPTPGPTADARTRRAPGLLREVVPGMTALEPTHLLSNGRYSVALRANGAGWSRWGQLGITRSRDDALRDAYGSFFHLRWDRQPQAVSVTQHPAPDPAAHYMSNFHADRVCFDAAWSEIGSHVTVWVSPEDDIEFRQIELRNLSDRSISVELMSSFEITLADQRADEAHPAFSNMFVRAEWRAAHDALVFERTPRLPTEKGLLAAHFLAESDVPMMSVQVQTDRLRWRGRNHDVSQPEASFFEPPAALDGAEGVVLDTGLDPVCAMAVRMELAPHSKAKLTFCTAATDDPVTLRALIDKYRHSSPVARASLMSATLTGIRLRELGIVAENFAAIQMLSTALVLSITRPRRADSALTLPEACDRRLLWRFGISGDRPILLVTAGVAQGLGLLRSLGQALRLWGFAGVACDLVVIDAEPASYLMPLQREMAALRERFLAESGAQPGMAVTSFHVLRANEVSSDELGTFKALARLHLNADGRPLTHHVQEWCELHEQAFEERHAVATTALATVAGPGAQLRVPRGSFAPNGGDYRFEVNAYQRPVRPWVNVLANPDFGTQLTEGGGGYSWAMNSRLNQLTPWSNDPVADTPGEWFLLQDLRTKQAWSVAPSAWGDGSTTYRVAHGQGHSHISHRRGDLEVNVSYGVDASTSVKQVRIHLVNRGHRTQRLRAIGIAEWVMGANRGDRNSVGTLFFGQRLPEPSFGAAGADAEARERSPGRKLTALLCTQRERSAGFGDGTAFFGVVGDGAGSDEAPDWTCDRRECFDARGRLSLPDHFGQRSGLGLDPCAALSTSIVLRAGESTERVFLLGFGVNADAARQLATKAAAVPAATRIETAREVWNELLGATTVKTPDPLFDAMVNRWLLYQTVSCRLWAKAGFYQAGGAYGFRDQLQDSMALAWAAPKMLRQQIILSASRQFAEGDVQHWWHAPTGAGVRTHFSDDLLWLPHAAAYYMRTTGDASLLDEPVPFLEGAEIPAGAEDAYYVPTIGNEPVSVYEHAARAIDRSLRVGTHGMPLMGTGDWNDGMNRVGSEGKGESVWLAWFLCQVVEAYTPLARERQDTLRVQRWAEAMAGWKAALQAHAWDGEWYKRAFFDDGTPLGSSSNAECRIDLIAQAWSVLSGAAPPAFQRMALAAMDSHLVDPATGLIKLLTPPLAHAEPSAGYIQSYPKGVRENGGQYSHAGVWAAMAQAKSGNGDAAYRYFTYLSPAHRTQRPAQAITYAIEPYVMAGDVYTEAPYVGRGGWSWYTGSAAWMHRAAIEAMFGLEQTADELSFTPALPSHWPQAELALKRDGRTLRFLFVRNVEGDAGAVPSVATPTTAMRSQVGERVNWTDAKADTTYVMVLPTTQASPIATAARAA